MVSSTIIGKETLPDGRILEYGERDPATGQRFERVTNPVTATPVASTAPTPAATPYQEYFNQQKALGKTPEQIAQGWAIQSQATDVQAKLTAAQQQLKDAQAAGYAPGEEIKYDASGKIIKKATLGGNETYTPLENKIKDTQQDIYEKTALLNDAQAAGYVAGEEIKFDANGKIIPKTGADPNDAARKLLADQANKLAQDIVDALKGTDVATRDTSKLLADVEKKLETTTAPTAPSFAADYATQKAALGLDPLETQLATIDSEIDALNLRMVTEAERAGERLVSMAEIGRTKGAVQSRIEREIALKNVEKSAISRQVSNKLDTLKTMMDLKQADYATARTTYEFEFNKNMQWANLLQGEEAANRTIEQQAKDDAKNNWQIMSSTISDAMKAGQLTSYDTLNDTVKNSIKVLELSAGLPAGFTQSVIGLTKPDQKVLTTQMSQDDTKVSVFYQKPDGTIEVKTYATGLPAAVSAAETVKPELKQDQSGNWVWIYPSGQTTQTGVMGEPKAGAKLSSAMIVKLGTAGVSEDVANGIFADLQAGCTLEEIRKNLESQFGREKGYGYLDAVMPILQGEGTINW